MLRFAAEVRVAAAEQLAGGAGGGAAGGAAPAGQAAGGGAAASAAGEEAPPCVYFLPGALPALAHPRHATWYMLHMLQAAVAHSVLSGRARCQRCGCSRGEKGVAG